MAPPPVSNEKAIAAPPPPTSELRVVNATPTSPSQQSLDSPQQWKAPYPAEPKYTAPSPLSPAALRNGVQHDLPPVNPVFGISLNELYVRDGTAVPLIVYQCFQAIELFGLEMEGIYRLSGSATHISRMKALFDNGTCWAMGPSD